MSNEQLQQYLEWATVVVIGFATIVAYVRGPQYRTLALATGFLAVAAIHGRLLLVQDFAVSRNVTENSLSTQLLLCSGLRFLGFCLLARFVALLGRLPIQSTLPTQVVETVGDVDARIIRAAGQLEYALRQIDSTETGTKSLGDRVQAFQAFRHNGSLRDLNFALGIRNSIAHPDPDHQPTRAEKERATGYLINALTTVSNFQPTAELAYDC